MTDVSANLRDAFPSRHYPRDPATAPMTSPALTTSDLTEILVARQPIFDAAGAVVAYELLYRASAESASADAVDAEAMAVDVIANAFLGIGIREITNGLPGFVNLTPAQFTDELWKLLDPKAVGIELLESGACTPDVVRHAQELQRAGYLLALDDFAWSEAAIPLLQLRPIVKVDVLARSQEEVAALVARLRPFRVRLLAERVETREVREWCGTLGFELFQGYFHAKPETLVKREPSASQLAILRLLNLLRDPNVADSALDKAFGTDVNLTYKLLRMVNSAATGARGIESIGHAVRLLGRDALHRWLSLLFISSLANAGGAKLELTQAALLRARLCEQIAAGASGDGPRRDAATAFMVGLFSVIDALLDMPMTDVLARVHLSDEVRGALLRREGPYAAPLFLAEAYEQGSWMAVRGHSRDLGIAGQALAKMYLEAIGWSKQQMAAK